MWRSSLGNLIWNLFVSSFKLVLLCLVNLDSVLYSEKFFCRWIWVPLFVDNRLHKITCMHLYDLSYVGYLVFLHLFLVLYYFLAFFGCLHGLYLSRTQGSSFLSLHVLVVFFELWVLHMTELCPVAQVHSTSDGSIFFYFSLLDGP